MTSDPRRIVDDLEAKIVDEELSSAADDVADTGADDSNPATPGVEPTD